MRGLLTGLLLWAGTAGAVRTHWMNPGTMGSNALASFPLEAPWVEPHTVLQVGGAFQYGWLEDLSLQPTFRLVTPFGKWAAMYLEGAPLEAWWSSARTRSEWRLTRTEGLAKADIRFGFKVLLADGGEGAPKLGFRALTKATTGKDVVFRRFIDAPAYLMELLLGQVVGHPLGTRVEICTSVGYWIWQQQEAGQNDAVHWALSVLVRPPGRFHLDAQARGFIGWQTNDKPIVLGLRGGFLATDFLELGLTANFGLVDAPRFEARVDLKFLLPSLVPLLFGG